MNKQLKKKKDILQKTLMNFLGSPIYIFCLVGYNLWGGKEWDMTERLTLSLSAIPLLCIFVYSIPSNPQLFYVENGNNDYTVPIDRIGASLVAQW